MTSTIRTLRRYDHRLRDLVRTTGDTAHAERQGVPRSTARGWLKSTHAEVFTVDVFDMDVLVLQQEVLALRNRVERLVAFLRLLVVLTKVSGFSLTCARFPDAAVKVLLLRATERSRSALPLRMALRILRLSPSRYHAWKREEECGLDDMPSCPRSSPQQLTRTEVETIKEMVTSDEYRHIPTGTLAMFAQRLGKVFASPSTWHRRIPEGKGNFPSQAGNRLGSGGWRFDRLPRRICGRQIHRRDCGARLRTLVREGGCDSTISRVLTASAG